MGECGGHVGKEVEGYVDIQAERREAYTESIRLSSALPFYILQYIHKLLTLENKTSANKKRNN